MRLSFIFLTLLLVTSFAKAQVRLGTLELQAKQEFDFDNTDIVVVDTLILHDSSRIKLNLSKPENFLHAKKMVVGNGVMIIGRGANGAQGKVGVSGSYAGGPCRDGSPGQQGTNGAVGNDAVNLSMYITDLNITGSLIVDLTGGDGGAGGKGGGGGGGSAGTKLCAGGSGGAGGPGSNGGNGGNGGNLKIVSPYGADLRPVIGYKILLRSFGGFGGNGGEGGAGGQKGLGSIRDGATGKRGTVGLNGKPGKSGVVVFERR